MGDPVDEATLFARMRSLDETERTSYAEKGRICLMVKQNLLHEKRTDPDTGQPCSLTTWIRLCAPWSYQTCFSSLRDMEELSDMPMKELAQVPQANFPILRQLSTHVRNQPTVIQAAQTKRSNEFIEHIQKAFPQQHVETSQTLRFVANQTQAAEIEEAITVAMGRGAMSRTEALVDLATNYRADVLIEQLQKENA